MTRSWTCTLAICGLVLMAAGCVSRELPDEPPPLADMEEPLPLHDEPADEDERRGLPAGGFTGIGVADGAETLDELAGGTNGVPVVGVVENSPGDFAGIEEGDLLLEARREGAGPVTLRWESQWRALELASSPGERIRVVLDRAGAERETVIEVEERLRPPGRGAVERFREEDRVGVVLRTATEVEARGAGLAPGGGAVVVGLSQRSPWRSAGVRFEDLVAAVDGEPVHHPQVVLQAIRAADEDAGLVLDLRRGGEPLALTAPVSERESEVHEVFIPPLFRYESERGRSDTSILFGLFGYEETEAAWEVTVLWLIKFQGGDADRLVEVEARP